MPNKFTQERPPWSFIPNMESEIVQFEKEEVPEGEFISFQEENYENLKPINGEQAL